ncbi:proteoglycan 4 [Culex quinquefasciatus]|uniref:proteoglycan 4 n=1 Tax=Culex quinquefasciatus TaxID=7176 RepID=UPI0018E39799|nr:proteoglycan 4 [Culex quinquefasciatus]
MSFFTSFQELLDFDHSTNLNGFHFSNSLFGFDSNSLPTLENLPPPVPTTPLAPPPTTLDLPPPPAYSPLRNPSPLLETPTKALTPLTPQLSPEVHYNHHVPQLQPPSVATPASAMPAPIVSKFQLKVTPNNEIYVLNESGTFCELAGSFVPLSPLKGSPERVLEEAVPEPAPKTLFCVERSGLKRPLSPSDRRYGASGIFHVRGSPSKKKSTSAGAGADGHGSAQPEGAKLVVSNVINNGLIVNKKHLSTTGEEAMAPTTVAVTTPERRIMRPKKRKRKIPPKAAVTLEAKLEPPNGRIVTKVVPNNTLNFSGIKEKAAQEAIFTEKVPEVVVVPPPPKKNGLNGTSLGTVVAAAAKEVSREEQQLPEVQEIRVGGSEEGAVVAPTSPSSPVELKVVADLVMDKEVFGHISLLNTSPDRGKTVIYQNPVTSRNVIYSILNPKSLNLALAGVDRSTTATLTLQPHRGGRKPKKRGRKPKASVENNGGVEQEGASAVPAAEPLDPSVPVMVTRSGRLSKPPRYANNFFQNMKQKGLEPSAPLDPPPPPPPLPPPLLPDPETAEKLPNFSAALNSVEEQQQKVEQVQKRKMTVPLQYRCATCNKIYLGKRMQRHLQKYPSHNSAEGERGEGGEAGAARKDKEEKSTYLYKHLFDLLQRFTEKDKGRIMLKEISNFVDFVRALIPRLITNDEQNSTVEYIDHNVADVLRLNHGKYRLKLSSLAEEYEKLNLTVNLLDGDHDEVAPPNPHPPITSTPNADRATFSFNADDLLNQSSSFPSLTTLMHEHHVLNTMLAPATNNNHYLYNNNVPQQQQLTQPQQHYTHNHHHHLNSLPAVLQEEPVVVSQPLAGLCKSPVQHHHHLNHHHGAASAGMVNMALNLY